MFLCCLADSHPLLTREVDRDAKHARQPITVRAYFEHCPEQVNDCTLFIVPQRMCNPRCYGLVGFGVLVGWRKHRSKP